MKMVFKKIKENLTKAIGFARTGHKYIKRTGTSGNYIYWYRNPQGKLVGSRKANDKAKALNDEYTKYQEENKYSEINKQKEKELNSTLQNNDNKNKQTEYKLRSMKLNDITSEDLKELKVNKLYQDKFIRQNQGFIINTAKGINTKTKLSFMDKVSLANEAVFNAIKGFDENMNTKAFLSYVKTSIINNIKVQDNYKENRERNKQESLQEEITGKDGDMTTKLDTISDENTINQKASSLDVAEYEDAITKLKEKVIKEYSKTNRDLESQKKYLELIDEIASPKYRTAKELAKKLNISEPALNKKIVELKRLAIMKSMLKSGNILWGLFIKKLELLGE